jgi:hypothetical protein
MRGRVRGLRFGRTQLRFDRLATRKLLAVVFREVSAALAIFELTREVCKELLNELATELPQPAQLVENESGISAVLRTETLLEGREHFLHALGRALLLLDAIFQAIDFVLQLAIGFLELRAIAKERKHPRVFGGFVFLTKRQLEETELS